MTGQAFQVEPIAHVLGGRIDAVDGTPVLDIKPWFVEIGPRGTICQAPWSVQMLSEYFAPAPKD